MFWGRYFYLILFFLVLGYFLLFFFLNQDFVEIDFYFLEMKSVSLGFTILVALATGMILSLILQIPLLFKKNKKTNKTDDDKNK